MSTKRKLDINTIQKKRIVKKIFNARVKALGKNHNTGKFRVSEDAWKTALSWKLETPIEEFVDFIIEDDIFKTDYEYINNLLLFIYFRKHQQKQLEKYFNDIIKESYDKFIEVYDTKITLSDNSKDNMESKKINIEELYDFIKNIIDTTIKLYIKLDEFPTWIDIYPSFNEQELYLYHGLEYNEVELFGHFLERGGGVA